MINDDLERAHKFAAASAGMLAGMLARRKLEAYKLDDIATNLSAAAQLVKRAASDARKDAGGK